MQRACCFCCMSADTNWEPRGRRGCELRRKRKRSPLLVGSYYCSRLWYCSAWCVEISQRGSGACWSRVMTYSERELYTHIYLSASTLFVLLWEFMYTRWSRKSNSLTKYCGTSPNKPNRVKNKKPDQGIAIAQTTLLLELLHNRKRTPTKT